MTFCEDFVCNNIYGNKCKFDGMPMDWCCRCQLSDDCIICKKEKTCSYSKLKKEGNKMNKFTLVISAYPACGKTYVYNKYKNVLDILDSDSSNFSWTMRQRTEEEYEEFKKQNEKYRNILGNFEKFIEIGKTELIKVRNPEFPMNYINHIKENFGKVDIIFVSSHRDVRKLMTENNIPFITVYPEKGNLQSWIGRMYMRGNNSNFINTQINNWNEWVNETEYIGSFMYRLKYNETIEDILKYFPNITAKIGEEEFKFLLRVSHPLDYENDTKLNLEGIQKLYLSILNNNKDEEMLKLYFNPKDETK